MSTALSPVSPEIGFDRWYKKASANLTVLAAGGPSATLLAARTGHTIYVKRIVFTVTTGGVAESWTVRDSAGTPVVIAVLPASATVGSFVHYFGDEGLPITAEKALNIVSSGAGVAGQVKVDGYYRQTSPLTIAEHQSA
jgi:hypothetical protein